MLRPYLDKGHNYQENWQEIAQTLLPSINIFFYFNAFMIEVCRSDLRVCDCLCTETLKREINKRVRST